MKKIKWMLAAALLGITASVGAQINVNTATVDELKLLKGIGAKKAEAIILYRKQHGDFKQVQDLVNVKGVSQKLLESVAEDLTVSQKTDLSKLKYHKKKASKSADSAQSISAKKSQSQKTDDKGAKKSAHDAHSTETSTHKSQ